MINPFPESLNAKVSRRVRPLFNRRVLNFRLGRPIVSFTFDDFPQSAADVGAKLLEAEGWRGTYYACAGLSRVDNHHGVHFAPEDLRRLEAGGHEIGGHTFSHMNLRGLPDERITNEIMLNQKGLKLMGVQAAVENFAYPLGEASIGLKTDLAPHFNSLRGIRGGIHVGSADLNELKSQALDSDEHLAEAHKYIRKLGKTPGWLILFTHDIRDNPSEWGCRPEQFIEVIDAVKRSGAQVLTVRDAIKTLEQSND